MINNKIKELRQIMSSNSECSIICFISKYIDKLQVITNDNKSIVYSDISIEDLSINLSSESEIHPLNEFFIVFILDSKYLSNKYSKDCIEVAKHLSKKKRHIKFIITNVITGDIKSKIINEFMDESISNKYPFYDCDVFFVSNSEDINNAFNRMKSEYINEINNY